MDTVLRTPIPYFPLVNPHMAGKLPPLATMRLLPLATILPPMHTADAMQSSGMARMIGHVLRDVDPARHSQAAISSMHQAAKSRPTQVAEVRG